MLKEVHTGSLQQVYKESNDLLLTVLLLNSYEYTNTLHCGFEIYSDMESLHATSLSEHQNL